MPTRVVFSSALIAWQRVSGRHGLPWQGGDAYRVWLSEIMLQQTQVVTVIPYFQRFIASYPTVAALACASEEEVLEHWSGLGYYARGRNLHRAAQMIAARHEGEFPRRHELMLQLPGIGRSTAAAICALAFGESRAILDGNVKRVLARYCGIGGSPALKPVEALLWQQAERLLPTEEVGRYTQALMDMGATLCTRSRPRCDACPVQGHCAAYLTGRVAELPTPRQKKVAPERCATFLLVMTGSEILLEKRASAGLWGGLWCLPQFDDEACARLWCAEQGMEADILDSREGGALRPFTHTFTHYKLHITPLLLRLSQKPSLPAVWMDVNAALSAAIPTPVRQLLEKIASPETV
ncbi:MAG: A/G-specific adenine glycosylase [Gallionella sp.]|nr:A/G-specific adenine glycosylase [Gallionella sp.]